ncbi:DUF4238 domain-containing protein [Kitasatospora sp. NPDC008115]|uniref:DUF4238 domain-containing protein n=1 Tax=Kitasatospora sp. NPDC008115 TaxID=3364022 RepID=UPI0036EF134E
MNERSPDQWLAAAQHIDARIEELRPQADYRHVVGQHVISKVLLKRFAVPFGSAGLKLVPFDLNHPDRLHKLAGLRECGKVDNFARFASASLEQVWGRLETRIPPAARAVERGDVFQHDQHVQTLKDLIALHLVRSLNYRKVHNRIFTKVYAEHRTSLLTAKSDLLRLAVLQRSGLHLAGPQGLAAAADQILRPHLDNFENGADFRARIEDTFAKAKEMISGAGLEILVPAAGEFLLGDTPALAIQQSSDRTAFTLRSATPPPSSCPSDRGTFWSAERPATVWVLQRRRWSASSTGCRSRQRSSVSTFGPTAARTTSSAATSTGAAGTLGGRGWEVGRPAANRPPDRSANRW